MLISLIIYYVLVEATVGEANLCGISSVVAMLASAVATKAIGYNAFWKVFVDELKLFERGKDFSPLHFIVYLYLVFVRYSHEY